MFNPLSRKYVLVGDMVAQLGNPAGSTALILHLDPALALSLRHWLEPLGWVCDCRGPADDLSLSPDDSPAIVLMEAGIDLDRRTAFLTALRASPAPLSGTPILLLAAPDAPGQNGTAGRIDLPLDRDQTLSMIEQWTGPIGEHRFRDLSSPHYRLVRLAGRATADRLLSSFAGHVEEALEKFDAKEDVTRVAHNIAGLAGTMGFGDISALWSAIERGESTDPDGASAATRAMLADLKGMIAKG